MLPLYSPGCGVPVRDTYFGGASSASRYSSILLTSVSTSPWKVRKGGCVPGARLWRSAGFLIKKGITLQPCPYIVWWITSVLYSTECCQDTDDPPLSLWWLLLLHYLFSSRVPQIFCLYNSCITIVIIIIIIIIIITSWGQRWSH